MFATKRATCIGCRTLLGQGGEWAGLCILTVCYNYSYYTVYPHAMVSVGCHPWDLTNWLFYRGGLLIQFISKSFISIHT